MTNTKQHGLKALLLGSALLASPSFAFESGSTGELGPLAPTVDTTIQLPEDGVLNYTTIDIPDGVTVRFERNPTNTPVVMLATGNVFIRGEINVSGEDAADAGTTGGGNIGDDGVPGRGGPGGFDGGVGGTIDNPIGGNGLGPGGGFGSVNVESGIGCGGSGAGYAENGTVNAAGSCEIGATAGQAYGNDELQPLIGGSGGGGGIAGALLGGAGGGGGGGAILIASSGTIFILSTGSIIADSGTPGDSGGISSGGVGGEGSGGAIRLVATTITGTGRISAQSGGAQSNNNTTSLFSGLGSDGRIRLEAENITRSTPTTPAFTFSGPQPVFLAGIPAVRISSVAGIVAPASPTGAGDIIIPEATPNPVNIEFETTSIPVGNTIQLTLTPQTGSSSVVTSNAITGSDSSGAASVSINIPDGPSTLSASVTFTIAVSSTGESAQDYSQFAKGEQVEKIRVDYDPVKGSLTTFIAASGQEYTWPSNTVAFN